VRQPKLPATVAMYARAGGEGEHVAGALVIAEGSKEPKTCRGCDPPEHAEVQHCSGSKRSGGGIWCAGAVG
jgi:hypothetical protein